MDRFSVKILGCGSATPSLRHNPSSQIVQHNNDLFMIDCGEGTQLQMRRYRVSFAKLRHIFISHLHGDHFLGLPGLLSTLGLHEVGGQVHVYMFEEGIDLLKSFLKVSHHYSELDIVYHPIKRERAIIYEDAQLTVETFPLYHTISCVGFIFRERPKPRKINGDMVNFHQVPHYLRQELRYGSDYVKPDGTVIPNKMLTLDPDPTYSYAYCSDTMFSQHVIDDIRGVTTVYHESTYADDKAEKAKGRGHSTARQAAIVAREAGAHQLILGHFSKSYADESDMLTQAQDEFGRVIIASEGMDISLNV